MKPATSPVIFISTLLFFIRSRGYFKFVNFRRPRTNILLPCLCHSLLLVCINVWACPIVYPSGNRECSYDEAYSACEVLVNDVVAREHQNWDRCDTEGDGSCRWCGLDKDAYGRDVVSNFRWSTYFPPPGETGYWADTASWYIRWDELQTPKTFGACNGQCPRPTAGNPIHLATGNKFQRETDYVSSIANGLSFRRYYNSLTDNWATPMGQKWSADYLQRVRIAPGANDSIGVAEVIRPDGKVNFYRMSGGVWGSDKDVVEKLVELVDVQSRRTGWQLTLRDDSTEKYWDDGEVGRLVSITTRDGFITILDYDLAVIDGGDGMDTTLDRVTDPFGRTMMFTHDGNGSIATMTDPAGGSYLYSYDAIGNLESVTYPDETSGNETDNPVRIYHYDDTNFSNALTGISDETGTRYATYAYDTDERAVMSEHAGGVGRVEIAYNPDGSSSVTEGSGQILTYHFQVDHGSVRISQIEGGPCTNCSNRFQATTYDANGFIASHTDFGGNHTTYINDARGLQISRTEAAGTPYEHTITTEWHADFRLPVKITQPGKITALTYDNQGRLLQRKEGVAP